MNNRRAPISTTATATSTRMVQERPRIPLSPYQSCHLNAIAIAYYSLLIAIKSPFHPEKKTHFAYLIQCAWPQPEPRPLQDRNRNEPVCGHCMSTSLRKLFKCICPFINALTIKLKQNSALRTPDIRPHFQLVAFPSMQTCNIFQFLILLPTAA